MDIITKSEEEIIIYLKSHNIMKMCRSCLSQDTEMFSIYSDCNGITRDMFNFFNRHIQSCVKNDSLPDQLCLKCFKYLSAAFDFKKQCDKSNSVLRTFLKLPIGNVMDERIQTEIKTGSIKKSIKTRKIIDEIDMKEANGVLDDNQDDTDSNMSFSEEVERNDNLIEKTDDSKITLKKDKYLCEKCDKKFCTSVEFEKHICASKNKNKSKLRKKSSLAPLGKRYQCSYCTKGFSDKTPWLNHEKTHTGERPYVCDVCGKSYIQKNNFVIHFRSHTGEKPFVCKKCGKAFTNGASLTLHMPIHAKTKEYVCTICGKGLARSGELTVHMRTHTGEKPYICQTCSKGFIKMSSLQQHMYSHTGQKKFECTVCGFRVARAGKLTIHMRTHSKNRPYSCEVCLRTFAKQSYLKTHSKIHFGDKLKPTPNAVNISKTEI